MRIISKQGAKNLGLTRYFTGVPCKRGHVCERIMSGNCMVCQSEAQRQWKLKNHEKILKQSKRYRLQNPDKTRESNNRYYLRNSEKIRQLSRKYAQLLAKALRVARALNIEL